MTTYQRLKAQRLKDCLSHIRLSMLPAILLGLSLAIGGAMDAQAKSEKKDNPPGKEHVSKPHSEKEKSGQSTEDVITDSIIDASARALMQDYFQANPQPVASLPPGIAKNVKRGKPLPPGIAKRSLPTGLQTELHNQNASIGDVVDAVIVGDDVAIIEKASGVVVEILKDIVRAQQ